ncbi:MAG: family 3 adenylate cyclase [Bacteroidetes bacterium]|nr:MAG: family 3 adenylate cyclase [Bacteroidota bacterium]
MFTRFIHKISRLSAKEIFSLTIILLPVIILVYALLTQVQVLNKPRAKNGVMNLQDWDPAKQGNVNLNGAWTFYWNQLLSPADFRASVQPLPSGFIQVPGIWNGYALKDKSLPAPGFATYMLDVMLPDSAATYMLSIRTVSNAYTMYINDKPVASNGAVGRDEKSSVPEYRPQLVTITPGTSQVRIIVQVSNFAHCKGGFWLPVEIGLPVQIQRERDSRVLLDMFLFGCLFIMAFYHFGLYFLRRSDPTTLYFGLMCAAIGLRSLLTGENLINNIWPGLDWFLARKIEYLLTFVSVPVYVTFARTLFPKEWNKTVYRVILVFGAGLFLFVLFTPTRIFTVTSYVFTGYAWLTSMYTIFVFARAVFRRQEGAAIFLATSLFFLLTIVNDTLNQLEIVHTGLYLSFGLFVVTFAQSYILSSRFANAFRTTEIYASTFRKFVPAQFMDKIAKDGIESIKAGNAEKGEVTVMFSDIRSFTGLSESMSPDEVFRMLNEYLSYVEPPIRTNNGFVDKYMGDGIMALFEDGNHRSSGYHAVMAALAMQDAMKLFNARRESASLPVLQTGIGLHTGQVIMGTLGGNERMDSTAIGDAVNLASRIEGMTKMYGASLLASEITVKMFGENHGLYIRFVDNVIAKGKTEPVGIWQIIGRKTDPALAVYAALVPAFEEALQEFRKKNFDSAKRKFESCLVILPGDTVSQIYLERCGNESTDDVTRLMGK